MGKYNKYNYWSNISNSKPKRWKVVDGKERIYSVGVNIQFGHNLLDVIDFRYKLIVGSWEKIDMDFLKEEMIKNFGVELDYDTDCFLREGGIVTYIKDIYVNSKEEYEKIKVIRKREMKIKRILKNI